MDVGDGFGVKIGLKMALWFYFMDCGYLAWEWIQFIGKRLEGWRAKMQGWGNGFRLNERRAHGLCFLIANQGVTHVTGREDGGKEKDESTREAQGIKSS